MSFPFDTTLPIHRYREEIVESLQQRQTLILCGETGSGKSTQLPQYCWHAYNASLSKTHPKASKTSPIRIAHTQPRRMAAISLAKRIGQEMMACDQVSPSFVGYKIRFDDKTADDTIIKLMTDGILIAESMHDAYLSQYRTIIIDEAHERNLNIDFLLGYLKNLLQRRHDLNLIITSATINVKQFSEFFFQAPIINVEGRSYPVSIVYRPIHDQESPTKNGAEQEESEQQEQRKAWREEKHKEKIPYAIGEAIIELWQTHGIEDSLVFLPGEFEIREVLDYLPGFLMRTSGVISKINAEVLPLYSRLSANAQLRIFQPTHKPRIILATNIAETSLTVPRIRYVIDSGFARVIRYSPRLKINRLDIEPIAQDAAQQRAGRCGRLGPGICVRLYSEESWHQLPQQTTPEILRSSLALVILRLLLLRWGDVQTFPWIDPPSSRMIHHGLAELSDLGAIDNTGALTPIGEQMARLQIDHTLSRMLIEAKKRHVLSELLIIVSALSTREVRELPLGAESKAQQAHRMFHHEHSDFLTLLNLWQYIENARQATTSKREFRKWCKSHFLSWIRIREWRELHLQLQRQVHYLFRKTDFDVCNDPPASKDKKMSHEKSIHQSMLVARPFSLGRRHDTEPFYTGPRGLKFFASSRWKPHRKKWVLSGEIIATPRPTARALGKIEPSWIIEAIPHLLTITPLELVWNKHLQHVMVIRQVSLQGLMLDPRQRVLFHPNTPSEQQQAHEIFIRAALIEEQIVLPASYQALWQHQRHTIEKIMKKEDQLRRPGTFIDDARLVAFYQSVIPSNIINTRMLLRYWRKYPEQVQRFKMDENTWLKNFQYLKEDYPGTWIYETLQLPIRYTFAPGENDDGMTITIDVALLPLLPVHLCEWLVPGMLPDKVQALIKTLPKRWRFALRDVASAFVEKNPASNVPLTKVLASYCSTIVQQKIDPQQFREAHIPLHLKMRIQVLDKQKNIDFSTRDLMQLKAYQAQMTIAAQPFKDKSAPQQNVSTIASITTLATGYEKPILEWSIGDWPQRLPMRVAGQNIQGSLVLVEENEQVFARLVADETQAIEIHRQGLLALLHIPLSSQIQAFYRRIPNLLTLGLPTHWFIDHEQFYRIIVRTSIAQLLREEPLPKNAHDYALLIRQIKNRFSTITDSWVKQFKNLGVMYKATKTVIEKNTSPIASEAQETLDFLFRPHVFEHLEQPQHYNTLPNYPRYLQGICLRLEKYPKNPQRDQKNAAAIKTLQQQIDHQHHSHHLTIIQVEELHGLMHELRIGLFAESLKTAFPISVKRIEKIIQEMIHQHP